MLTRLLMTFAVARQLQRGNGLRVIKLSQSRCSGMPNLNRTRPQQVAQQFATHLLRTILLNTPQLTQQNSHDRVACELVAQHFTEGLHCICAVFCKEGKKLARERRLNSNLEFFVFCVRQYFTNACFQEVLRQSYLVRGSS